MEIVLISWFISLMKKSIMNVQLFSLFKATNQIRDFKGICNFEDYLWNISNYCFRPLLYFCMMFEHMKNEVLMKLYTSKLMKRTTVRH